jgi:uncharacterized protein YndB with AHSA1/START domain
MTTKAITTLPPLVKTVSVPCSTEDAFRYFTQDFEKWWPGATHSVVAFSSGHKDKPALCTMEARQGGKIFERANDGKEYVWGTIMLWDPPKRMVFTWHPGMAEDIAQNVEIAFAVEGKNTRVTLTHTGWERLGADADQAWKSYNNGWEEVFTKAFATYAGKALT